MRIASFDRLDIVNTPGTESPAFTIWFAGCHVGCNGCHNEELQNPLRGKVYTADEILGIIDKSPVDYGSIVLLGGEPMEQPLDELLKLCSMTNLKIWLYTSYELDQIPIPILDMVYTVKTGKYEESLRTNKFPASSNQRIWRVIDGRWKDITEYMEG